MVCTSPSPRPCPSVSWKWAASWVLTYNEHMLIMLIKECNHDETEVLPSDRRHAGEDVFPAGGGDAFILRSRAFNPRRTRGNPPGRPRRVVPRAGGLPDEHFAADVRQDHRGGAPEGRRCPRQREDPEDRRRLCFDEGGKTDPMSALPTGIKPRLRRPGDPGVGEKSGSPMRSS